MLLIVNAILHLKYKLILVKQLLLQQMSEDNMQIGQWQIDK